MLAHCGKGSTIKQTNENSGELLDEMLRTGAYNQAQLDTGVDGEEGESNTVE